MARTRLTDRDKHEIIELFVYGEAAKDLAEHFTVSRERVYQILRDAKVEMHQPHDYGSYENNGRKCVDPRPNLTLDSLMERLAS